MYLVINEVVDQLINQSICSEIIIIMCLVFNELDIQSFNQSICSYPAYLQRAKVDGSGRVSDVKGVMDTWTLQMNYPVVKVTVVNGKVRVQQKRFLQNPSAHDPQKYISPFGWVWIGADSLLNSADSLPFSLSFSLSLSLLVFLSFYLTFYPISLFLIYFSFSVFLSAVSLSH